LEVEAAAEDGRTMDASLNHLQDQVADAFGAEVFQRFTEHLERLGSPSVAELSATVYEEGERFDALLDALAGEPRED
jgi:hypothetical protein